MYPRAADSLSAVALDSRLLKAAREELWGRGWTRLPDILPRTMLDLLNDEADRLLAEVPAGPNARSATDAHGGVLVMNGLDARSEMLFDFARTPALTTMAAFLLGKVAMPIHIEYFGKPKAGAEPTPPHQDQVFYQDHFSDEPAITFWCPLQDVPVGAGALEYASLAAANGVLLPHRGSRTVDFGAQLADADGFEFVRAPVAAGDCLVHHAYTVHRSGPMAGQGPRRVFAFNYRGSSFRQHLQEAEAG